MDKYTEEEIMKQPFGLWYRERIIELKRKGLTWSPSLDIQLKQILPHIEDEQREKDLNLYEMREWNSVECELPEKNRTSKYIINPKDSFLMLDNNGKVLYGHSLLDIKNEFLPTFITNTKIIGNFTIDQYKKILNDKIKLPSNSLLY